MAEILDIKLLYYIHCHLIMAEVLDIKLHYYIHCHCIVAEVLDVKLHYYIHCCRIMVEENYFYLYTIRISFMCLPAVREEYIFDLHRFDVAYC